MQDRTGGIDALVVEHDAAGGLLEHHRGLDDLRATDRKIGVVRRAVDADLVGAGEDLARPIEALLCALRAGVGDGVLVAPRRLLELDLDVGRVGVVRRRTILRDLGHCAVVQDRAGDVDALVVEHDAVGVLGQRQRRVDDLRAADREVRVVRGAVDAHLVGAGEDLARPIEALRRALRTRIGDRIAVAPGRLLQLDLHVGRVGVVRRRAILRDLRQHTVVQDGARDVDALVVEHDARGVLVELQRRVDDLRAADREVGVVRRAVDADLVGPRHDFARPRKALLRALRAGIGDGVLVAVVHLLELDLHVGRIRVVRG